LTGKKREKLFRARGCFLAEEDEGERKRSRRDVTREVHGGRLGNWEGVKTTSPLVKNRSVYSEKKGKSGEKKEGREKTSEGEIL